jgi:hypothetical protein
MGRSRAPALGRSQVRASPAGVHELPAHAADPRTVSNLFDGATATCDETHMWLAPFTPGRKHRIAIQLPVGCQPSRLKVWNYNSSRAHTQRGARAAELRLGGRLLLSSEIRQAGGTIIGAAAHATTFTFTRDQQV